MSTRSWLLGCALALLGCGFAQAQQTAPAGRSYSPGAFTSLEIDGTARIRLSQGDRDRVFVAGDDAVQNGVDIDRSGDSLRIRAGGGWKFWRDDMLTIDVQMRQPNRVALSGAGELQAAGPIRGDQLVVRISGAGRVRFDDLAVRQVRLDISGAGDAQLAGRVDQLDINVSGKGKVLAEPLRAVRARVSISGVGSAELWVVDELHADISGAGKVDFWGHPAVRQAVSGVGAITPRGDKATPR